jgi:hypothetical protein
MNGLTVLAKYTYQRKKPRTYSPKCCDIYRYRNISDYRFSVFSVKNREPIVRNVAIAIAIATFRTIGSRFFPLIRILCQYSETIHKRTRNHSETKLMRYIHLPSLFRHCFDRSTVYTEIGHFFSCPFNCRVGNSRARP